MSNMPERVTVWHENFREDDRRWMNAKFGHGGTEYVRADLYESLLSEVTNIAQESVARADPSRTDTAGKLIEEANL